MSLKRPKSNVQYVFKVGLAGRRSIWRKIALRGDQTLDDLHEAIFHAFDRFDEHLYSFYFPKPGARGRDRLREALEYGHPMSVEDSNPFGGGGVRNAATVTLDSLKLKVGQRFEYPSTYSISVTHGGTRSRWSRSEASGVRVPRSWLRSMGRPRFSILRLTELCVTRSLTPACSRRRPAGSAETWSTSSPAAAEAGRLGGDTKPS